MRQFESSPEISWLRLRSLPILPANTADVESHIFFFFSLLSAKVPFECWETLQAPDARVAQIASWSHGVQTRGLFF